GEAELLYLTDERDDVAVRLATEAVVDVLLRVHRERGRLLAVEGAEALPATSHPPELHVLADDRDDVRRSAHGCHVLVDDPHGRRGYRGSSSWRPDAPGPAPATRRAAASTSARATFACRTLAVREPSLDDVFLALTGRRAEADDGQADDPTAGDGSHP